jgi:hypothetical protein
MRQRLSNRLLFDKIILVTISFIVLPYWLYNYPDARYLCAFAVPIIVVISYFVFYFPDSIEFDQEKMYVTKWSRSQDIDLKDIRLIKMTILRLGYRNCWKIEYLINNKETTARFYSRYFSIYLNDFFELVKKKNPKANIDKPYRFIL